MFQRSKCSKDCLFRKQHIEHKKTGLGALTQSGSCEVMSEHKFQRELNQAFLRGDAVEGKPIVVAQPRSKTVVSSCHFAPTKKPICTCGDRSVGCVWRQMASRVYDSPVFLRKRLSKRPYRSRKLSGNLEPDAGVFRAVAQN